MRKRKLKINSTHEGKWNDDENFEYEHYQESSQTADEFSSESSQLNEAKVVKFSTCNVGKDNSKRIKIENDNMEVEIGSNSSVNVFIIENDSSDIQKDNEVRSLLLKSNEEINPIEVEELPKEEQLKKKIENNGKSTESSKCEKGNEERFKTRQKTDFIHMNQHHNEEDSESKRSKEFWSKQKLELFPTQATNVGMDVQKSIPKTVFTRQSQIATDSKLPSTHINHQDITKEDTSKSSQKIQENEQDEKRNGLQHTTHKKELMEHNSTSSFSPQANDFKGSSETPATDSNALYTDSVMRHTEYESVTVNDGIICNDNTSTTIQNARLVQEQPTTSLLTILADNAIGSNGNLSTKIDRGQRKSIPPLSYEHNQNSSHVTSNETLPIEMDRKSTLSLQQVTYQQNCATSVGMMSQMQQQQCLLPSTTPGVNGLNFTSNSPGQTVIGTSPNLQISMDMQSSTSLPEISSQQNNNNSYHGAVMNQMGNEQSAMFCTPTHIDGNRSNRYNFMPSTDNVQNNVEQNTSSYNNSYSSHFRNQFETGITDVQRDYATGQVQIQNPMLTQNCQQQHTGFQSGAGNTAFTMD